MNLFFTATVAVIRSIPSSQIADLFRPLPSLRTRGDLALAPLRLITTAFPKAAESPPTPLV